MFKILAALVGNVSPLVVGMMRNLLGSTELNGTGQTAKCLFIQTIILIPTALDLKAGMIFKAGKFRVGIVSPPASLNAAEQTTTEILWIVMNGMKILTCAGTQ